MREEKHNFDEKQGSEPQKKQGLYPKAFLNVLKKYRGGGIKFDVQKFSIKTKINFPKNPEFRDRIKNVVSTWLDNTSLRTPMSKILYLQQRENEDFLNQYYRSIYKEVIGKNLQNLMDDFFPKLGILFRYCIKLLDQIDQEEILKTPNRIVILGFKAAKAINRFKECPIEPSQNLPKELNYAFKDLHECAYTDLAIALIQRIERQKNLLLYESFRYEAHIQIKYINEKLKSIKLPNYELLPKKFIEKTLGGFGFIFGLVFNHALYIFDKLDAAIQEGNKKEQKDLLIYIVGPINYFKKCMINDFMDLVKNLKIPQEHFKKLGLDDEKIFKNSEASSPSIFCFAYSYLMHRYNYNLKRQKINLLQKLHELTVSTKIFLIEDKVISSELVKLVTKDEKYNLDYFKKNCNIEEFEKIITTRRDKELKEKEARFNERKPTSDSSKKVHMSDSLKHIKKKNHISNLVPLTFKDPTQKEEISPLLSIAKRDQPIEAIIDPLNNIIYTVKNSFLHLKQLGSKNLSVRFPGFLLLDLLEDREICDSFLTYDGEDQKTTAYPRLKMTQYDDELIQATFNAATYKIHTLKNSHLYGRHLSKVLFTLPEHDYKGNNIQDFKLSSSPCSEKKSKQIASHFFGRNCRRTRADFYNKVHMLAYENEQQQDAQYPRLRLAQEDDHIQGYIHDDVYYLYLMEGTHLCERCKKNPSLRILYVETKSDIVKLRWDKKSIYEDCQDEIKEYNYRLFALKLFEQNFSNEKSKVDGNVQKIEKAQKKLEAMDRVQSLVDFEIKKNLKKYYYVSLMQSALLRDLTYFHKYLRN